MARIIDPAALPARTTTVYPPDLAAKVAGREKRALGTAGGLTNFGVNLTRLAPGAQSALRHWHSRQDELVYILEGRATLVTEEGEAELGPGMAAAFPAGEASGHMLVNRGADDVVYLEVGDRSPGDQVTYPDDDLEATMVDGKWRLSRRDGTPLG
ncbi:MAG: lpg2434 family Dot/Icm T4SS effector [Thalassobaculales bacterium]